MIITSAAFKHKSKIPSKYTCDGENINPPLELSGISRETKSLVLIMDDPDAPSKTWVHWVVYNIDPSATKIEENSVPSGGVEGLTDFGSKGYGGPCPHSGTHRYFFKLYALGRTLDAPEGLTKRQVLENMDGHVLDETELMGLYSKK